MISYAAFGAGGVTHLAREQIAVMCSVNIVYVPYRGGAPEQTAAVVRRNIERFAALMKAAGIRPD